VRPRNDPGRIPDRRAREPDSTSICTVCAQTRAESGHRRQVKRVQAEGEGVARLLLYQLRMRTAWMAVGCVTIPFVAAGLRGQPGPPNSPHDPRAIERRMGEIRNRLDADPPTNSEQRELAAFVQVYLDDAARALAAGRRFQAERLADAADACRRPIDHLRHAVETGGHPPAPGPVPTEDHLRQVYFRLRLSEFFLQQIAGAPPKRLLDLARANYQRAVTANQEGRAAAAEEYTKAADDLTHALESLAQAQVPEVPPKL
jgi:hypothetical protein